LGKKEGKERKGRSKRNEFGTQKKDGEQKKVFFDSFIRNRERRTGKNKQTNKKRREEDERFF